MKITITKTWHFELEGTKALVTQQALKLTDKKQPDVLETKVKVK
jgi:hypothetical protein